METATNAQQPVNKAAEEVQENPPSSSVRSLGDNICLGDFDLGVTLGTGSFGRVKFAMHRVTKTVWAIKMLKKSEVVRLQQVSSVDAFDNI